MPWQTPKTNWQAGDVVGDSDLNRIESNLARTGPAVVQAAGDILVATGANALGRLPIGQNGQVLQVSGGAVVWGPPPEPDEYLLVWSL